MTRELKRILLSELESYPDWTPVMGETLPSVVDVVLIERVSYECHTDTAPVDKQGQEPDIEQ